MEKAGYYYHCGKDGRPCFHRKLCDDNFPRFHLYANSSDKGIELDLHFDQYHLSNKGNHGKSWAYEGSRVYKEMQRIIDIIENKKLKQVYHSPIEKAAKPLNREKKKKNFIKFLIGL